MQRSSKCDKKDPQILTNGILCRIHEEQAFDRSINHVHAIHEGVQIFYFPCNHLSLFPCIQAMNSLSLSVYSNEAGFVKGTIPVVL